MPATDQHLRAIAFLAKDCRPHGARIWDEGGIYDNLAKIRDRSLGSIIIAAIQAAEDRNALTPGVIPKAGPHWRTPEAAVVTTADRVAPSALCDGCGETKATCELRIAENHRRYAPDDPRYDDHTYTPVAQASAHKRTPEVCADIREVLAAEKTPMREPSHEGGRVTAGAGRARVGAARTDRDDLINPTTEEHQ